ncbi:MAG TPA: hypothetical protein VER96_20850 [Polyangiaceae bacterium]|nr:hypothetical protein [Polyangiaceae bacterium]
MKTMPVCACLLFSMALFSACGGSPEPQGSSGTAVTDEAVTAKTKPHCVQNVLCIRGSHFDTTLCKCVPNPPSQCISKEDGPCGGFTLHPCQCAAGLTCVLNINPDLPGTCEPARCCPANWNMYDCKEENGGTGHNCHNPALGCPSSLTCGDGCDFEVSSQCPVCDPIVCPAHEVFSRELCKCVSCVTAADCTGPLPQLCRVCADGSTACAHWSCVANACEVATCN